MNIQELSFPCSFCTVVCEEKLPKGELTGSEVVLWLVGLIITVLL